MELSPTLSPQERDEYQDCEATLDATEDSFIEYVRTLKRIRDKALYREDFSSFDEYLANRRKKYTRQRVSQLIQHIEVLDALSCQPAVDTLPESERQTRELLTLSDPVEQASAWIGAQIASGQDQPSSGWVKSGVETVQEAKINDSMVDTTGTGEMKAFTASITAKEAFRRDRQRDYINASTKREPPLIVVEMPAGKLADVVKLENVDPAEIVRIVVYKAISKESA